MSDYIERGALLEQAVKLPEYNTPMVSVYAIQVATAADVVAVKHGRWKYYHKQNIAVCTNCSFERDLDANFGKAITCPNCGAKMDGE